MRFFITLAWACILGVCALARVDHDGAGPRPEPKVVDRQAERDRAVAEILETNFFYNGKGVLVDPLMSKTANFSIRFQGLPYVKGTQKAILQGRWGLNYDAKTGRPVGIFDVPYEGATVSVMGCVACHSGRVAGRFYVGAGNRNIDVTQIGYDIQTVAKGEAAAKTTSDGARRILDWGGGLPGKIVAKFTAPNPKLEAVRQDAVAFGKLVGDPDHGNLTQGLVPTSTVFSWFYRIDGKTPPHGRSRGQVRVPALWGYGEKRKVGQFSDGFGDGTKAGWAVLTELTAGQTPQGVRAIYAKAEHLEENFGFLLPPPYPFAIDRKLADKGRRVFEDNCQRCHGVYERDEKGFPIFRPPRFVRIDEVKTDTERLDVRTPELGKLIASNPLVDVLAPLDRPRGYFAPRLDGIWARFPYLHNGSIPNIEALLTPPAQRPRVFSLRDAGEEHRFSQSKVGLTLPTSAAARLALARAGAAGDRTVYDVRRPGHGNQGHDFGTDLSDEDKLALIEFLKTL